MDFGSFDFGGGHGLFDGGGHHGGWFDSGHHGGGHHGDDMSWLWAGGVDFGADAASANSYHGSGSQTGSGASRFKPPLLLSAGGGAISGLIANSPKATLGLSLLSGVAIPYLAMRHSPNLPEVAASAGVSALVGAITQQAKQNWAKKVQDQRIAADIAPEQAGPAK